MPSNPQRNRLLLRAAGVAAVGLVLAGLLIRDRLRPLPSVDLAPLAVTADPAVGNEAAPRAAIDPARWNLILHRPLEKQAEPVHEPSPVRFPGSLFAIVDTAGVRKAVIDPGDGNLVYLAAGETGAGITVDEIKARTVAITYRDTAITLELD